MAHCLSWWGATNFEPDFYVEHFVKDMEIALAEARGMNLALALQAQGHSRKGTQALSLALEHINNISYIERVSS